MTDVDWTAEDDAVPECVCDAPDPDDNDEPWVPVVCGNCGGRC